MKTRALLKSSHALVGIVQSLRLIGSDWRRGKAWMARRRLVKQYLRNHPSLRKLNLGAGPNELEGWLNTDILPRSPGTVYLDAAKAFPFPDQTFDYIFSEHMIEHLPFNSGVSFTRECFRVLRPSGRIRIATPDMRNIAGLFVNPQRPEQVAYIEKSTDLFMQDFIPGFSTDRYGYRADFVLNMFFWLHGHRFVYDFATMRAVLAEAGFCNIVRCAPSESSSAHLANVDSHWKMVGKAVNQYETMVLEAVRP